VKPGVSYLAVGGVAALFASCTGPSPSPIRVIDPAQRALSAAPHVTLAEDPPPAPYVQPTVAWADGLPKLRFVHTKSMASDEVRLYAPDGALDPAARARVDRVLAEDPEAAPKPFNRRVLRLVVKAAQHFGSTDVMVVSSWRASTRGGSKHRVGEALDFMFPNTSSAKLAAYLRKEARVGVGIYTHPRTRYVHLDVRDQSYHWLDGSPPGRSWREQGMFDRTAIARDLAYAPDGDLPAIVAVR
jgi:uncharacterized protein YcbK (DUF882 family)